MQAAKQKKFLFFIKPVLPIEKSGKHGIFRSRGFLRIEMRNDKQPQERKRA